MQASGVNVIREKITGQGKKNVYRGGHIWASMNTCSFTHSPVIPGGLCFTNTDALPHVSLCCTVRGHLSPSIRITPGLVMHRSIFTRLFGKAHA